MELLVIGLGGLSYNILERFDVDFHHLDRVREEVVSGDLMSVDTPITVPAWTSFATGLLVGDVVPKIMTAEEPLDPWTRAESTQEREEREAVVEERLSDLGYME